MHALYQIYVLNEALLAKSKSPFPAGLMSPESQSFERPEKHKLVLIVDDEEAIADSLAEILNTFGYQSRACYNGEQAIEFAHQQCPDVVLSDVLMPGLDGVETALRIRELCPYARILLFSGQANVSEDFLHKAQEQGQEFELLAKPIHPEKLLRILSSE
jgi:CheY-like chemotaxis protein